MAFEFLINIVDIYFKIVYILVNNISREFRYA